MNENLGLGPGPDDKPLVGNSADKKQIREARKHAKYTVAQEKSDLQKLLGDQSFRRFYWGLLEVCGVFLQLAPDAPESVLRFHEGKRNIGLRYLKKLGQANPQALIDMMAAHNPQSLKVKKS